MSKVEVKETPKAVTLKTEVTELANLIKKDMKLDKASGVALVSEDLYAKTLPEGVTKEIVQQIQEHNTTWAAAGLLALGETSIEAMKKHKDLEHTTLEVPTVGKDNFSFRFERSKEVRNVATGETSTKHGVGSVGFNMYGAGKVGEVKKVRSLLADRAAEAYGS